MRALLVFTVLALAACQPAPQPESAPPEAVQVAAGPITSAAGLEGMYRVAGIEGYDLADLPIGFSVSIGPDEIDVPETCFNVHWRYRFEAGRIVTEPVVRPPCRGMLSFEGQALTRGFSGAERVTRTPANGILIEGSGPAITLFSQ